MIRHNRYMLLIIFIWSYRHYNGKNVSQIHMINSSVKIFYHFQIICCTSYKHQKPKIEIELKICKQKWIAECLKKDRYRCFPTSVTAEHMGWQTLGLQLSSLEENGRNLGEIRHEAGPQIRVQTWSRSRDNLYLNKFPSHIFNQKLVKQHRQ